MSNLILPTSTKPGDIYVADLNDLEEVSGYAEKFLEDSPYKDIGDKAAVKFLVSVFLDGSSPSNVILLYPGKGMLAARATPFILGTKWIATEIGWWVEPEHRKTGAGKDLLQAFEAWAKHVGCSLITMISLDDDLCTYYEKQGYKLVERAYLKEI